MKRTTSSGPHSAREATAAFKPEAVRAFVRTGAGSQGGSLRGHVMRFTKPPFMRNVFAQSALLIDCRKGATVREQ